MSGLQTLDQQRAACAWEKVSALGGSKEYLSLVLQLPAMVQTNGLGQTLAFLLGPADAKQQLCQHLQQWLCTAAPHPPYAPSNGQKADLMRSLTTGDSLALRRATLEVQALALWLKRFAAALDDGPVADGQKTTSGGS